jgi:hypothetical protein
MHRSIAAWLTEHPLRAAIASAICGILSQLLPPFIVFAAAIPVLVTLQYGGRLGLGVAVVGTAATGGLAFTSTDPAAVWVAVGFAVVFVGAVLLTLLLKRTQSLNLCYQLAVLGASAMVIAVHVTLPDPIGVWTGLLHRLLDSMAAAGLRLEGDQNAIVALWAKTMWGALATFALLITFGSLLMGRWWHTLLRSPGSFGMEYRKLRLGATLGVAFTAVFVAAFAIDSPLLSSLAWVAFSALVFQGLAAAHRSKAHGKINRGWLAAIYVLLIVPLSMSVTVFALAVWGFADNWLRLKAQNA